MYLVNSNPSAENGRRFRQIDRLWDASDMGGLADGVLLE